MRFKPCYIIQFISLVILSIVFIVGSLYFNNNLNNINQEKSLFPVLIYVNSLSEANDVLNFITPHKLYLSHEMVSSEELERSLIDKYDLVDYRTIAGDFRLPYQLVLYLKSASKDEMVDFVNEIAAFFPTYIINYNERIWLDIENHYNSLNENKLIKQLIYLLAMILVQINIRSWYIMKNKTAIDAVTNSGIKRNILMLREFTYNIVYIGISILTIFVLYIIINSFGLVSFLTDNFLGADVFLNWNYKLSLGLAIILSVLFQKPLFIRMRKTSSE